MYSSSRRLLRAVAAGSASQRCARAPRFRVAREFSSAADASSAVASAAQPALPELDATAYQQDASDNASDNEELFEDPRQAILQAALKHVGREGWTREAIAAGAHDVGYPSVSAGMFERGPIELVWHIMRKGNEHMSHSLEGMDMASMSVNERIKAGVKARLMYQAPYARTWAQAMALGLYPTHAPETLNLLAVMSDEIWYWAGDRSTNLNWYSRRLLLMGVYAATETFMLTDRSKDFAETWEFLDRRLVDVTQFGRQVGESLAVAQSVAGGAGSIATAAFDMVRPAVLGPSSYLTNFASTLFSAATAAASSAAQMASSPASAGSGTAPPAQQQPQQQSKYARQGAGFAGPNMTPDSSSSSPISSANPAIAAAQSLAYASNSLQFAAGAVTAAASAVEQVSSAAQQVAASAGVRLPDASQLPITQVLSMTPLAPFAAIPSMILQLPNSIPGFSTGSVTASSSAPTATSSTAPSGAIPALASLVASGAAGIAQALPPRMVGIGSSGMQSKQ